MVIERIYDESIKEYKPLNEKYHYLNYYNFFMGMRITQNRVDLKKVQFQYVPDITDYIRKINYSGNTKTRYESLNKNSFGTDGTNYCSK